MSARLNFEPFARIEELEARIETLEAALREIATGENSFFGMMKIARDALDKDAGK